MLKTDYQSETVHVSGRYGVVDLELRKHSGLKTLLSGDGCLKAFSNRAGTGTHLEKSSKACGKQRLDGGEKYDRTGWGRLLAGAGDPVS